MTAQIAIMNREAVALASDSAVTVGGETEQKIFTSANKLFALSKYHPVGVMVYGSAIFMGIPWETIIKIYRKELGKKKFDTLEEYSNAFIEFMDNGNPLFSDAQQEMYVRASIYGYFRYIRSLIEDLVRSTIEEEGKIDVSKVEQIVSTVIEVSHKTWEEAETIPSIAEDFSQDIAIKYEAIINEGIRDVFELLPISQSGSSQLKEIAASLFSKFPEGISKEDVSGVVIAGFGEKDIFPSLRAFDVEGMANNRLKYAERIYDKIDFDTGAAIVPFAQREMVSTFMEGIDPSVKEYIFEYLSRIFKEYPAIIVENIGKLDDNEKQLLQNKLTAVGEDLLTDYVRGMLSYLSGNYVDPVLDVVATLPKDELAAMAESLVNLTSFKRKVSMAAETVGGPIDVAVISKGDGFIWIKRKHYFETQLNPQFFANYYQEV